MIPTLFGTAVSVAINSARVLVISGSLGTGYGLGRKYGRKMCEKLDTFDERVKEAIRSN